ncbi:unnamed protein product [Caenorhabditis brenneri]
MLSRNLITANHMSSRCNRQGLEDLITLCDAQEAHMILFAIVNGNSRVNFFANFKFVAFKPDPTACP